MIGVFFPVAVSWAVAVTLAIAGLVQIAGSRMVREAYARWEFPRGFAVVTGSLDLAAAACLAIPELRVWGIALAAVIMFGAVTTLLSHRQYLYAVPAMILMVALIPAALAIPRADHHVHYAGATSPGMAVSI